MIEKNLVNTPGWVSFLAKFSSSDSDSDKICQAPVDPSPSLMVGLKAEVERAKNFDCVEGYGTE